jgi:hypothetical protein
MAITPTKTPILGNDEASRRYEDALAKLTESLDDRKRLFDPTLLAMAQGFLAPTQTGGFGESLGNAAKNVGAAQEAEEKRNQEILQTKLAIAGQGVDLARSKADYAAGQEWLKSQGVPEPKPATGPLSQAAPKEPPEAPMAPTGALSRVETPTPATPAPVSSLEQAPAPMAAPAAGPLTAAAAPSAPPAQPAPPPGFGNIPGQQIMPPNKAFMTQAEHVAANLGRKPFAELMKEGAEIERHRFEKNEGGMFDKRTGMFYPIASTGKMVDIPIYGEGYGPDKTYRVSEENALKLGRAQANGDFAEYKRIADMATGRNFGKTVSGTPVAGGSVEERDIAKETAKELAKAKTSREISEIENFEQKDREARDTLTLAKQFKKFSEDPAAEKMAGILNNDKYSSIVAKAVESGIGNRTFHVGIPELEDIMRNAGLNKEEQAKYRTFLMLTVESQLLKTKYMKGSISNYEDKLLGNAGINAQDTPATIRMKADLFTRRAQFDRRAARAFEASGMTAKEFLKSKTYDDMRAKYDEDLADLSFGNKVLAPASKPAKGGKDLDAARARVKEILGD